MIKKPSLQKKIVRLLYENDKNKLIKKKKIQTHTYVIVIRIYLSNNQGWDFDRMSFSFSFQAFFTLKSVNRENWFYWYYYYVSFYILLHFRVFLLNKNHFGCFPIDNYVIQVR